METRVEVYVDVTGESDTYLEEHVRRICEALEVVQMLKFEKHQLQHERDWMRITFEVTLKLNQNREWADVLCQMVRRFEAKCLEETTGRTPFFTSYRMPVLHLSSTLLFREICIPAHMNIPLQCVHWGNLQSNADFLCHITKFSRDCNAAVLSAVRNIPTHGNGMMMDMEHDRNHLIVRFGIQSKKIETIQAERDRKAGKTPRKGPGGYVVSLIMKYTSVRRVCIDMNSGSEKGIRIYFLLNYPVTIRQTDTTSNRGGDGQRFRVWEGEHRERYYQNGRGGMEGEDHFKNMNFALNETPVFSIEFTVKEDEARIYDILSRLRSRIGLPLDFCLIASTSLPLSLRKKYVHVDAVLEQTLLKAGQFGLLYLFDALLSRGAIVKDQLLRARGELTSFVMYLARRCEQSVMDRDLVMEALERLLNEIDEQLVVRVVTAFNRKFRDLQTQPGIHDEIREHNTKEGFQRVRKVVVTPTRLLYVVPELMMGNRILRNHDVSGDAAIRISFRDDDGTQLRSNAVGAYLIEQIVGKTLENGLTICKRKFVYLGSSNSQMRDNGCYFFDDTDGGRIKQIREEMGKFDKQNIPKMMARMGQCFTQAKKIKSDLKRCQYSTEPDVEGGRDENNEKYCFSDGVGRISRAFARQIARDHQLGNFVPSCFQFRFRGFKGVVSVDPALDERNEWAERYQIRDNTKEEKRLFGLKIIFRPSQEKFRAPRTTADLEIVKYSSPTPVCLNRPMIAILDQVSSGQSWEAACRVGGRIHALLSRHLHSLAESLMSEQRCRDRLSEMPRRISIDRLSMARGFALTTEPFFRSLLQAAVKYSILKQLRKEQIQVPYNYGRSLFGVVDETGMLQYGQVFVQITNNIGNKMPGPKAAKTILKGQILMTKNPCIVSGDIRLMTAVDIPELRHLVDVVVFPRWGSRPHPNEMAGSDLDGDEYAVIWDPQLMFDYNEPPISFCAQKREPEIIPDEELEEKMRDFYVSYITQDSIGAIANAHIVNSDLYGIEAKVCMDIAKKHSMSVDFPKTGLPPEPLKRDWILADDGTEMPPERPERFPDFMAKNHEPAYISPRLVGQLFRRIKMVEDVLKLSIDSMKFEVVELDEEIDFPGWQKYEDDAKKILTSYNANIRALLENYGITDEGQLFSGAISEMRNRISDRDTDDMSFYTTSYVIEQRASNIFQRFRELFFVEFGGFTACTQMDDQAHPVDADNVQRRLCVNPTDDMMRKAVACYRVTYGASNAPVRNRDQRLLSFPWTAWDILAQVKQNRHSQSPVFIFEPLAERISHQIAAFVNAHPAELANFERKLLEEPMAEHALARYMRRHKGTGNGSVYNSSGLDQLFFVLCTWGNIEGRLTGTFSPAHLCLLLIQFGVGQLNWEHSDSHCRFLERTDELTGEQVDLIGRMGGLGRILIKFLQFLASRDFEASRVLNFLEPNLGCSSYLIHGEWLPIHREIHIRYGRVEMEPFMIELPEKYKSEDQGFAAKLQRLSGLEHLQLRRLPQRFRKELVVVSAVGTLEAVHKLRQLLAVRPNIALSANCRERSDELSELVYQKIAAIPDPGT